MERIEGIKLNLNLTTKPIEIPQKPQSTFIMNLQEMHDQSVAEVAEQVKAFHKARKPFRIYHATTGSTRPINFRPGTYVDTSKLNRIFPVDKSKRTVRCEPKVAMDELVVAVQKQGYLPEVVPELMGLTVGGCFSGTAGESSSYKYGLFEETVIEIEIILANGTVTKANTNIHADLYIGAGSSMGTLGIVTLLEVKLVEARKFVQVDLVKTHGITDAINKIEEACGNPRYDFIDGMLFTADVGVVMFGRYVDEPQDRAQLKSFVKRNEPWFTNYVESVGNDSKQDPKPICLAVEQYFFRYDRGVFWGGKLGFDYFHMPFNRLTRWLLDPLMGSRVAYHALHEGGFASKYIVQDFSMPWSKCQSFVSYIQSVLPKYQFYLCPAKTAVELKIVDKLNFSNRDADEKSLLATQRIYNIGVYGKATRDFDKFIALNREMEHKVWHDFCGVKMLYAHAYYTEEEFWQIYRKEVYDEVRRRYKAEGLPTVYDKINSDMKDGRKPPQFGRSHIGALRGMLGTMSKNRQTSYLLTKGKGKGSGTGSDLVRKATAGRKVPITNAFAGVDGQTRANQMLADAIGASSASAREEPATYGFQKECAQREEAT